MATTARPTTAGQKPTNGGNAPASARARLGEREQQYDLLTATLIGVLIGAGAALLVRRGPTGRRPIGPIAGVAARGARVAGGAAADAALWAGKRSRRGARWAAQQGGELWDRIPRDHIREEIGDAMDAAREAVADTVESELRDLRKAIRRQRKRLGV